MTTTRWNWKIGVIVVLYACAGLQFVRFYIHSTSLYLNMPAYLAGQERLPFQTRLLAALLMRSMLHLPHFQVWAANSHGLIRPELVPFYVLSLVSLFSAAALTQWLYFCVTSSRALALLIFPAFLYVAGWTYLLHVEANFSYPYDFLSLAFFTAGLICIYRRRYLPLLLVMLFGTVARETTLFLVGLYIIDAASKVPQPTSERVADRFNFRQIPLVKTFFLITIWVGMKVMLSLLFSNNSHAESYIRAEENLGRLKLRILPAIFNICGYLLPIICLYWKKIQPHRFGNYICVLLLWFPVMFAYGDLVETRIYGELCSFTVVAAALLLERKIAVTQNMKVDLHAEAVLP